MFGCYVSKSKPEVETFWKAINSPFVVSMAPSDSGGSGENLFSYVKDASELEWEDGLADVYASLCDISNERFLQHSHSGLEETVHDEGSEFTSDRTDIVERTYAYAIKIPDEISDLTVTMETWYYPAQRHWLRWWLDQFWCLSFVSSSSRQSDEMAGYDGPSTMFALKKFQSRKHGANEQNWDEAMEKTEPGATEKSCDIHVLDDIIEEENESEADVMNASDSRSGKMRQFNSPSYPSIVTIDTFESQEDDSEIDLKSDFKAASKGSSSPTSSTQRDSSRKVSNSDTNIALARSTSAATSSSGQSGRKRSNPVQINYDNVRKTFDAYATKCKSDGTSDDGSRVGLQVPINSLINLASAVFSLPDHVLVEETMVSEEEMADTLSSLRDYVNYAQQQKRSDTAMMKFDPFLKWLENACGAILLKRRTLMSKKLDKKHSSKKLLVGKEDPSGKEDFLQMELDFDADESVVSEMTRDSFLRDLDNSSAQSRTLHPEAVAYNDSLRAQRQSSASSSSSSDGTMRDVEVGSRQGEDDFSTGSGAGVQSLPSRGSDVSPETDSDARSMRSAGSSTVFEGGGVVVSELCNSLDFRPTGKSAASHPSRALSSVAEEESSDVENTSEDFRYSDVSYAGRESTHTRHSTERVLAEEGALHSKIVRGFFEVGEEEFDVELDESGESSNEDDEESFEEDNVEVRRAASSGYSSGKMSDLTGLDSDDSRRAQRLPSYELQEDDVAQLVRERGSSEQQLDSDDLSLDTMGNLTLDTRQTQQSEGTRDDESRAEDSNGVKIKETLFFM